jgi:hypothetical protein
MERGFEGARAIVSHRRGAVQSGPIVKNNGISLLFGLWGGGEVGGRCGRAPYEPKPAKTIEAQSASFNFASTLICTVRSSARRAVPAPVETPWFPNALLRPHGTDRQLDMPAVGKFEGARNNMPGTALDDESGAVREPAGETIGSAHLNLLKNARSRKGRRAGNSLLPGRFRLWEDRGTDFCELLWRSAPTPAFARKVAGDRSDVCGSGGPTSAGPRS